MNKQFFKLLEEIDPNKFDMVYSSPNGMTVLRSSEYGFRLDQIHELKQENQKYKEVIDKTIENWNILKRHFEFLKINTTGGNKEFMEDILEIMNTLEGGEEVE